MSFRRLCALVLSVFLLLGAAGCGKQQVSPAKDDYVVAFADPVLESAVRTRLGFPASQQILCSDLNTFKLLTVTDTHVVLNNADPIELEPGDVVTTLADLVHFKNMGGLVIDRITPDSLESIGSCEKMQRLSLTKMEELTDISFVAKLPRLVVLMIADNPKLTDFSPLRETTGLLELDIHKCGLTDIEMLENLVKLKKLAVGNNYIDDIAPLKNMPKLTEVDLRANRIADVSPLSGKEHLTKLRVDVNRISDPAPLAGLPKLQVLVLDYNQLSSLEGLRDLPELTLLRIRHNKNLTAAEVSGLRKRLPENCTIEWA